MPLPEDTRYTNELDSPLSENDTSERPKIGVNVDPLSGATVTLNGDKVGLLSGWTGAKIEVGERMLAKADVFNGKESGELIGLLNDPSKLSSAIPLSPIRTHSSGEGTRGVRLIVDLFPDQIVSVTGIGVVKLDGTSSYWRLSDRSPWVAPPEYRIDPPQPDVDASTQIPGGSLHIDEHGRLWVERNVDEPFGAISLEELNKKVANTLAHSDIAPAVIAAGGYEENPTIGWMAYSLPFDVLSPEEVTALDVQLPPLERGRLYGGAIAELMRVLKTLHDKGEVHYQAHPGNWFARFTEEGPRIILTDWETLTDVTNLPNASEFETVPGKYALHKNGISYERIWKELSPAQRAKFVDLQIALRGISVIDSEQFIVAMGKGRNNFLQDIDAIAYRMRLLSHAVSGYLNPEISEDVVDKIQANLLQVITALAPAYIKNTYQLISRDNAATRRDLRDIESLLDCMKVERGYSIVNMLFEDMTSSLILAVLSEDPKTLLLKLQGDTNDLIEGVRHVRNAFNKDFL